MLSTTDYVVAFIAGSIGLGSAFTSLRLPDYALYWNIARKVHQRWGATGVRILYLAVAILMSIAVVIILMPRQT